jgi:hypothetical protein
MVLTRVDGRHFAAVLRRHDSDKSKYPKTSHDPADERSNDNDHERMQSARESPAPTDIGGICRRHGMFPVTAAPALAFRQRRDAPSRSFGELV